MQMCVGARKQLLLLLSRSLCMIEARTFLKPHSRGVDVRDYWWPSEDDWALIFSKGGVWGGNGFKLQGVIGEGVGKKRRDLNGKE